MTRKIEKMYELFGVSHGNACKDCMHFCGGVNEYKKCKVYGSSHSEATDWAKSWVACGLFNKEWKGDVPIVRTLTGEREEEQVAGQMSVFDFI